MDILLYALLWLSFGFGHSITAKISVQEKLIPFLGKYYRLCYNAFAAVHFLLVLSLGAALLSTTVFPFVQSLGIFMNLTQLTGLIFIVLALRQYDLKEFSGLSALMNKDTGTAPQEKLNTSGLNAWVRHPLYSGALIYFWGGAVSELGMFTALFGSTYLFIGSMHEEKKLVRLYGDAYSRYQQSVPRFIPQMFRLRHLR